MWNRSCARRHIKKEKVYLWTWFCLESFSLTFKVGKSGAQGRTSHYFLEESPFSRVIGFNAAHYNYNLLHTSIPQYLKASKSLFLHMAENGSKWEQKGRWEHYVVWSSSNPGLADWLAWILTLFCPFEKGWKREQFWQHCIACLYCSTCVYY